jgi:predicted membrane protein
MQDAQPDPDAGNRPPHESGGWNLPALFIAIAVTVVMTVYPRAATKSDGSPDMLAAALLFWAMSAGFIRGLGFIPNSLPLRLLFSLPAALVALAAALGHLYVV